MRESNCDPDKSSVPLSTFLMILGSLVLIPIGCCCIAYYVHIFWQEVVAKWKGKRKQKLAKSKKQKEKQNTQNPESREKKMVRRRKFDAYVCYNFEGENDFVTDTVLPVLEENHSPPFSIVTLLINFVILH